MKSGMACVAALLALGACASPVRVGTGFGAPAGGELHAFPGDEFDSFDAGFDAALAAAERPGDAALGCDQLAAEATAIALDPAVQGVIERMGGGPEEMLADVRRLQQQQLMAAAASAAIGLLGRLAGQTPGLNLLTSGAQAAITDSINAASAAQQAQMMRQVADIQTILPQTLRGARIQELAEARRCDFIAPAK